MREFSSSPRLSCTVTAGWAPGMGGLISPLSISSLLAILEMGGNTIPLQFGFKPHRSICWTSYSWAPFYHSFPPYFNSLLCFYLTLASSLSLFLFNCLQHFITFPFLFLSFILSEFQVWLKQTCLHGESYFSPVSLSQRVALQPCN